MCSYSEIQHESIKKCRTNRGRMLIWKARRRIVMGREPNRISRTTARVGGSIVHAEDGLLQDRTTVSVNQPTGLLRRRCFGILGSTFLQLDVYRLCYPP